jgi:hypothetical protein
VAGPFDRCILGCDLRLNVGEGWIEYVGTIGDADALSVDLSDTRIRAAAGVYQYVDPPACRGDQHQAHGSEHHTPGPAEAWFLPERILLEVAVKGAGHVALLDTYYSSVTQ